MKKYLFTSVAFAFGIVAQMSVAQAQGFESSTFKCEYSDSPHRSIQIDPYNDHLSRVEVIDSEGRVKESDHCARYKLDSKNVYSLVCPNLISGFGTVNILYNASTNNMTVGSIGTTFEDVTCKKPLSSSRAPASVSTPHKKAKKIAVKASSAN